MEFLKNHYEKILLSLVLIGLAGAAGMLAIQALEARSNMAALVELKPNIRKPAPIDAVGSLAESLTNAKAPQRVDFDGAHKIFNPEKILRNRNTGELIPNGEIGPKNLVVQQIRPLRLVVRAESKTVVGRKRLYLHYLAEFEYGSTGLRWNKRTISKEGSQIRLVGQSAKAKQMMFTVNKIGDPEGELSVDLELTVGAGLPIPIQLRGTNTWEREMEYAADLHYPPENRGFQNVRANQPLFPPFAGDTNYVIQITRNAVTLRSLSNQKRITLRWPEGDPEAPDDSMPAAPKDSMAPSDSGAGTSSTSGNTDSSDGAASSSTTNAVSSVSTADKKAVPAP